MSCDDLAHGAHAGRTEGEVKRKKKPIDWQISDACAFHGFVQAGLSHVRNVHEFEKLVAQAGEQWGYTPSKAKGPPPSDEEKNVTRAIQLTNGLERWTLVQRLWRLRRVRQRLRAQCMVRDVLTHPERRGWGHKFLPGAFGSSGVWYFVRDGQYVRDRREMSEMLLKTFGDLVKDEADDHSTDWVWGGGGCCC